MLEILCPIVNKLEYSTDFAIYIIKTGFTGVCSGKHCQADILI